MFLDFQPIESETRKYEIIRDYFVSNGQVQGMFFIVKSAVGNEIKKVFLDKEDVNNTFEPKKTVDGEIKLKASGIEIGEENLLIIETGVWKKRTVLNKEIEIPAKRYRFILKK